MRAQGCAAETPERLSSASQGARILRSAIRHVTPELVQPDRGPSVARRTPVTARRERAARAHLRCVGHRGALELAQLEESLEEHAQPLLDRRQIVLVPSLGRDQLGPGPTVAVAPGAVRQVRDLAGAKAEAGEIV